MPEKKMKNIKEIDRTKTESGRRKLMNLGGRKMKLN